MFLYIYKYSTLYILCQVHFTLLVSRISHIFDDKAKFLIQYLYKIFLHLDTQSRPKSMFLGDFTSEISQYKKISPSDTRFSYFRYQTHWFFHIDTILLQKAWKTTRNAYKCGTKTIKIPYWYKQPQMSIVLAPGTDYISSASTLRDSHLPDRK